MQTGNEGKHKCWSCENVYGGCEWTEYDPDKGGTAFRDVPGWTVEKRRTKLKDKRMPGGYQYEERVVVLDCPKYIPDGRGD